MNVFSTVVKKNHLEAQDADGNVEMYVENGFRSGGAKSAWAKWLGGCGGWKWETQLPLITLGV